MVSSVIQLERLVAVVGAIPRGRWMSYGDVAFVCGGLDRRARTLNQRFIREQVEGAHRVLKADGTISWGALGAPDEVRTRLEEEGVLFVGGAADQAARLRAADFRNGEEEQS